MLETLKHSKLLHNLIILGLVLIVYHFLLFLGVVPSSIQDLINVILEIFDACFHIILMTLHLLLNCLLSVLQ